MSHGFVIVPGLRVLAEEEGKCREGSCCVCREAVLPLCRRAGGRKKGD